MQTIGVRAHALWLEEGDAQAAEEAAEVEALGYSGLFFPTHGHDAPFAAVRRLLDATRDATVATGIVNVWDVEPAPVAAAYAEIEAAHPGRFLLGLGVGHAMFVDADHGAGTYHEPVQRLRAFVEGLRGAGTPVARERILLGAHGPRMLGLARELAGGTHPYLVTPEQTRGQRAALGPGAFIAPEQKVLLASDPATARAAARERIGFYLTLPNFRHSLLRGGFTEADLEGGGSDRLVDGVVAWGDEAAIAARVREHLDAGADHVAIQVIGVPEDRLAVGTLRRLAPALLG